MYFLFGTIDLVFAISAIAFRAILCNSQAKREMKNFDPPQILHAIRYCGGCLKMHFVWVNSETVVKCAKGLTLFLKSIKTLQTKT